jgi:CRISPR/Cas system-associated exonuclease Cas4 (RecB family)
MISLVEAIKKGIDKHENEHDWNEDKIHISDLAVALDNSDQKCPRQVWLRLNGYDKKENSPGVKMMLKQGHNLHEFLAAVLSQGLPKNWNVFGIEEQVNLKGITGRYDFALLDPEGNKYIVDFKTVRGNAFNYLREPKKSHILQVQSYIMATDAVGGFVLYADREGQNFVRQFAVERNDKKVEKAIEKAKQLKITDIPPAKLEPKIKVNHNKGADSIVADLPWQCQYCNYRNVSCEGAIPSEFDDNLGKVVGHIREGCFDEKVEGIGEYIEGVI